MIYESHAILTHTIPDTHQTAKYIQTSTRSTGKRSTSAKYYCCAEPYRYKRSAFHRILHIHNHIQQLHNKTAIHTYMT